MKCLRLLRDWSVVMKLGAALLDIVIVGLCGVWGAGAIPPYNSPAGAVVFIHALAGCLFVLPTLLLAQTLGDTLGPWTQRVFLLMGLVTLLPLGGCGIYISVKDAGSAMQISIATLCLAAGLLLLADFVYLEKLFCCFKIES